MDLVASRLAASRVAARVIPETLAGILSVEPCEILSTVSKRIPGSEVNDIGEGL
jgi:hypothetical protein